MSPSVMPYISISEGPNPWHVLQLQFGVQKNTIFCLTLSLSFMVIGRDIFREKFIDAEIAADCRQYSGIWLTVSWLVICASFSGVKPKCFISDFYVTVFFLQMPF